MIIEENENYSVIVPDYLLENEEDPIEEDPIEEDPIEEDPSQSQIDYSEYLLSIDQRLENIESFCTFQIDFNDNLVQGVQGILSNTSFLVYFGFAFFVFGALALVIKFFKQFF